MQLSYLVDLEVVFDDFDLATLSSIASLGHRSRGSAVSVSIEHGRTTFVMGFFFLLSLH